MFKLAAKTQGGTQKCKQVRQLRVSKRFIYTIFTMVKESVPATRACDGEHGDLRKRDNSKVSQKLNCKNLESWNAQVPTGKRSDAGQLVLDA